MSDYMNEFLLDDQSQTLEHANLDSPVYPAEDHQALLREDSPFDFEQFLNNPNEEMTNLHTLADEEVADITQANHTQAEFSSPLITDNITVDPQFLDIDFFGNNTPFPAAVGLAGPSNTLLANIMQPVPNFPAPFEFSQTYRHDILNAFPSPTYPLHIIDTFGFLPQNVVEALHQGLKRQREHDEQINQFVADIDVEPLFLEQPPAKKRKVSKGKGVSVFVEEGLDHTPEPEPETAQEPEVFARPIKIPGKHWIKPNSTTQGKNKRSTNIQSFDPSHFYMPLEQPPRSWGRPNRAGVLPFSYTQEGELNPHIKYTAEQMKEFIFNHPGHNIAGQRHTKQSGLTIWIQSVPSDSAARYPHQNSDKCRFVDCPVRNGTIHKGHYRVAFDEQSSDPVVTDPFHNAGHVHLYCLEKFLDFPFICANFNVQPDDRILPEGRNKMAITRDHIQMKKIVRRFVRNAEREQACGAIGVDPRYENTLNYRLTAKHLELEPANRQGLRDRRPNANSMDKHMNNLDFFVARNNERKLAIQSRPQIANLSDSGDSTPVRKPTPAKTKKRKAVEVEEQEDAEFEIDENILDADSDTIVVDTQSKDTRPAKRTRVQRNSTKKVVDNHGYESSSSDNESFSEGDVSDWAPAKRTSRSSR